MIVIPNDHFENVYAVPDSLLAVVYVAAKRVATALKTSYGCEGTSMRQHNEPGGGQDVWHFHVHVFPRRTGDLLYERNAHTTSVTMDERAPLVELLRPALSPRPGDGSERT